MTDTPRTDARALALQCEHESYKQMFWGMCDHARDLERECTELLNALRDCIPGASDNIGVSERNVGFRDGWNAARSFTKIYVERAIAKRGKP